MAELNTSNGYVEAAVRLLECQEEVGWFVKYSEGEQEPLFFLKDSQPPRVELTSGFVSGALEPFRDLQTQPDEIWDNQVAALGFAVRAQLELRRMQRRLTLANDLITKGNN